MKTVWWILIAGAIFVGVACVYSYETGEVRATVRYEQRCTSSHHQGDALVEVRSEREPIRRCDIKSRSVVVERIVCSRCKATEMRIQQEKAAEKERQRKEEIARQEREADAGKLPPLLGKNFGEVVNLIGAPDSKLDMGTIFSWEYDEKPSGYRTSLDFVLDKPDGTWENSKQVQAITTNIKNNQSQPAPWNIPAGVVPMRILKKEPIWMYAWPAYNQLTIVWKEGKCVYEITVQGSSNEKVYVQSSKADTETGDVKKVYQYSGVDWKNLVVVNYAQHGPNDKFSLPPLENVVRVK